MVSNCTPWAGECGARTTRTPTTHANRPTTTHRHFTRELHGLRNVHRHILDGALLFLANTQNDGVRLGVGPHDPHRQRTEVLVVDELAQGRAGAPNDERVAGLLGKVALVDEAGDDVPFLDVEVVILAIHVAGDDGGEVATVLVGVAPEDTAQ